jgi:hypothetical protein
VETSSPPNVNPRADDRRGLAGYVEFVLRSLFADRNLAVTPGALDVSPILIAVRTIVLVMVLVTVPLAEPHLGVGAQGTALAVALGVCVAGGVVWFFAQGRERVTVATLAVLGWPVACWPGCPRSARPSPWGVWSPPLWAPG